MLDDMVENKDIAIDKALIHRLVHTFYAAVQQDARLGPIFDAHINDWDMHLAKMCSFWSSVILRSREYHGQPMPKHVVLDIDAADFDIWLTLFEQTVRDLCPPQQVDVFMKPARSIAASLEMGLAQYNKVLLKPGARYYRNGSV